MMEMQKNKTFTGPRVAVQRYAAMNKEYLIGLEEIK